MVLKEVGEILTFRFVQVLAVTISSNDLFLKLYVFQQGNPAPNCTHK